MVKNSAQRGQILIILLLVLVVALAIVLSLVSRSVTDIRTSTSTEQANRAYFAAESGVEDALKKLKNDPSYSNSSGTTLDFTSQNQSKSTTTVTQVGGSTQGFAFPNNVASDNPAQVNFLKNYACLNDADPVSKCRADGSYFPAGTKINVFWGDDAYAGAVPALELTLIYESGGTYSLKKFAFDQSAASRGNNFSLPLNDATANCDGLLTNLGSKNYKYCQQVDLGLPVGSTLYLGRIRLLYNPQSQPVAVAPVGPNVTLPAQGAEIVSTGTVAGGATRKLKVFRSFPSLPGIFDFVLFNGSSNSLSK